MSQQDAPGFGEGLEDQVPLEEPDPDQAEADDATDEAGEPTEAEVLQDDEDDEDRVDDDADDVATESPSGPPA